jgi:hypothetical protein
MTRNRRRVLILIALLVEPVAMWLHGSPTGRNVAVRCKRGHLFTTIWIPGASLKSLRFGWWRLQWCPVGKHWSFVTPVRDGTLAGVQRRVASRRHDLQIP